jgi:hypothetical protein
LDRIGVLEYRLSTLLDEEARAALDNFSMFEILNMEKMTPAFLSIAKQTKKSANLSEIKSDTGVDFNSELERENYIRNYYADIYSVKADTAIDAAGCIERFLGDRILNEPAVRQSKLSKNQRLELEGDITTLELDNAIKKNEL